MLKTIVPFAGAKPVMGLTIGAAKALLVKETRGTKIPLVVEVMSSAPAGAVVPIPTCAKDVAAQAKKEIKIILFMIVKYIKLRSKSYLLIEVKPKLTSSTNIIIIF